MSSELAAVIRMTIVMACAGLLTLVMKRASASTRHAVWAIALLCGLLLPLADVLLPQPARLNLPLLPARENEAVIVRSVVPEGVDGARLNSCACGERIQTTDHVAHVCLGNRVRLLSRPIDGRVSVRVAAGSAFRGTAWFDMESSPE